MKILDENDARDAKKALYNNKPFRSRFDGKFLPPNERPRPEKPIAELTKAEHKTFNERLAKRTEEQGIDKEGLRWKVFSHLPADQMMTRIQRYVFPFLKDLNGSGTPFTRHMSNAVFAIPKASLLTQAVNSINDIYDLIDLDKASNSRGSVFQDIQGDIYEYLLSEIATAGKNGQFRTPRQIIKLLVELVDPQLNHRIADPACGTGGFLLGAFQYIITQRDPNPANQEPDDDGFIRTHGGVGYTPEVKAQLQKNLIGYDIDQGMVRLGLMNLMMHGIEEPKIDYMDTLSKKYVETSSYNIVLANPPFTGSIDKSDKSKDFTISTGKTELLFIDRIHQMLVMGGTAGVIVPQGVLFSSSKAFVDTRKIMVEQSELKAVISMDSGIFRPYAGVATAILIFTKASETTDVWFYHLEEDGHTMDDKRTNIPDYYGDLQDIVREYKSRDPKRECDRKGKFFFVPKAEIIAKKYDLSFSRYKEDTYEEIEYENPADLLTRLLGDPDSENELVKLGLEGQINKSLHALKALL